MTGRLRVDKGRDIIIIFYFIYNDLCTMHEADKEGIEELNIRKWTGGYTR